MTDQLMLKQITNHRATIRTFDARNDPDQLIWDQFVIFVTHLDGREHAEIIFGEIPQDRRF